MKSFVWFAVLLLLLPRISVAKRAFTISDLYQLKAVAEPQISPDGRKIAFVVTRYYLEKGTSNADIYLINADGTNLHPVTFNEKKDTAPRWSPDGKQLLFLSNRHEDNQLWLMEGDFSEPRQITHFATEVTKPGWSADQKFIQVFPECGADNDCNQKITDGLAEGQLQAHLAETLYYRYWNEYRDGRFQHTFCLELASKSIQDLTPGAFNSPPLSLAQGTGYSLAPDGQMLCFESKRVRDRASSTNNDLFLLDLNTNDLRNITTDNEALDSAPQFSPDGKYIAYLKQVVPGYEADRLRVAIYNRASGQSRTLTEALDYHVQHLVWAPDSKSIFLVIAREGYYPLYRVNIKSGQLRRIPNVNAIDGVQIAPDGRWLVFTDRRVDRPLELYRVDTNGENLRQLTFFNQKVVDEVDIRPAEQMWIQGADDRSIHVFLIKPHNFQPRQKYPLIVNVHGGPQMQWSDSFRGDWQVYPGAGYVVAFPNPHGSIGYGQEFTAAISQDYGGKVIEDVLKITRHLAELEYIDENRIGAMGWSWGGYAMNWLEGHNEAGLFKCLVSMMGLYDLRSFYGATEELWFPEWDLGGQPWNSAIYQTMSPSSYVEKFKTPMLVITGEKDYRVPYTQNLQLFTDLQKMGVPSRLIIFKEDGHWPNAVKSMPFYYNAHLDWFHQYLGGAPAPWDLKQMWRNLVFETKD